MPKLFLNCSEIVKKASSKINIKKNYLIQSS